ncbi:MAG: hypothetical protein IPG77_02920 [Betaproteobacteria bacterium]|nr:hypothetical protein [Betaproteobacteria bacterium]
MQRIDRDTALANAASRDHTAGVPPAVRITSTKPLPRIGKAWYSARPTNCGVRHCISASPGAGVLGAPHCTATPPICVSVVMAAWWGVAYQRA